MYNSCENWENCDFSCNDNNNNTFYGDDAAVFYDNDLKPNEILQPQQQQGSLYGPSCRAINEPSVNFNSGGFYNNVTRSGGCGPIFNATPGMDMLRYHPYQRHATEFQEFPSIPYQGQQTGIPYMRPRMSLLNLDTPCRGSQPWGYEYCYGYAPTHPEPCQYSQFVDIEDFM